MKKLRLEKCFQDFFQFGFQNEKKEEKKNGAMECIVYISARAFQRDPTSNEYFLAK